MDNNITFVRYRVRDFLRLMIVVILVLTTIYFTLPNGFYTGVISAVIYVFVSFLIFPIKYVFTNENTIETHFLFGKRESKTVKINSILEMRLERLNHLVVRYMKDGYSQPASTVLELDDQKIKEAQHELLKRNPNIVLT